MSNVESIQGSSSVVSDYYTVVGSVQEINASGIPLICIEERGPELLEAELGISASDVELLKTLPVKAVIVCSSNVSSRPIITSLVRTQLSRGELDVINARSGQDVSVDGRVVRISGKEEMLFECGKSSILLRRDGKVVIKGTQLLSRASGSNKLKGSSVNIN